MKPGGILALSTPHRLTDVDALFERLSAAIDQQGLLDRFEEYFDAALDRHKAMLEMIHRDTIDDTVRMLEEAGFRSRGSRSRPMSGPWW